MIGDRGQTSKGWERECSLEICGEPSTDTRLLRRGVDRDKDEIRLENALVDIGREKQVPSPRLTNDVLQPRLIDRQLVFRAVPGIDASLVQIDDGDSDMRAFESDNGTRRTTCRDSPRSVGFMASIN